MREPWMIKGLSISSRKVWRLFKKTIGKERTHHAFEQYIRYRNLYNQSKRIAKQSHYGQILEEYKNNTKMVWKTLNTIINKSSDKRTIIQTFKVNGNSTSDPSDIADGFCNYFTNIGKAYSDAIIPSTKDHNHYLTHNRQSNPKSFYISPTDENEVRDIIKNLKPNNSSGHDKLTSYLLKLLDTHISRQISILINKSIENGIVPDPL